MTDRNTKTLDELIGAEFDGLEHGSHGYDKLAITLPPRHGKTKALLKHGARLVEAGGRSKTTLVVSHTPRFAKHLAEHLNDLHPWAKVRHVAIGGGLSGTRGDIVLFDDTTKHPDRDSAAGRVDLYRWMDAVVLTRMIPGSKLAMIQSRTHAHDLVGRAKLGMFRGGWRFVNVPAIAVDDHDPLRRAFGRVLDLEHHNLAELANIRRACGEGLWASLYMGRPIGEGFPVDQAELEQGEF